MMSLLQLRNELKEIKMSVKSQTAKNSLYDIPLTPEIVRCCNEFLRAQNEARKRLINSGISESELKKHEYENFFEDPLVMRAHQNKLIALSNTRIHDREPMKINYLYSDDLV